MVVTLDATNDRSVVIEKDSPLNGVESPVGNKLFVYGIFLGKGNRDAYGMSNPQYATVPNFVTVGGHIVKAVPVEDGARASLTGLLVDVDPQYWAAIDNLEYGYDRNIVTTTNGVRTYMYTVKGINENEQE